MAKFVGRRAALGIAREITRGTIVVPSTYWIPTNSIDFDDKAEVIDQESALGSIQSGMSAHVVKKYAMGSFEADLEDKMIGLILSALVGAAPSTSGSTNYTHAFSIANTNSHQSVTLAVVDPNATGIFPMAMLDTFEINVNPQDIVRYNVSFRSQNSRDWAALTPAYTALGTKFLQQHCSVKIAAAIANLAAASALSIRSLNFKVEKNLADFDDIGTVTPGDIVNKQFVVTGSIELAYSDRTYRDLMLNNTYRAMEIKFETGTNNSLTIQMPRLNFRSWEPNKSIDDIATEKIEFRALTDAANAAAMISTLSLKNQVASY